MEATIEQSKKWDWKTWALYAFVCFVVYCGIQFYKISKSPRTYDDCIMENIKPGDSDTAAKIKAASCRSMHPDENPFARFKKN